MSMETEDAAMSNGRSLLTDRERAILAGNTDVKDNYRYKVESIARQRVRSLEADVKVLRDEYPEIYEELQKIVCEE